jgi:predicted SAM-dependent methyltransferase
MKLEIGPGPQKIDSTWTTVGPFKALHVDYIARWGEEPLPFEDNSVDQIYASHVLEHVIWHKTIDALKETHRILKPGGFIEIHVPNFAIVVKAYLEKRCGDNWRAHNKEGNYMKWVNGRVFTYGGPGNTHRALFDRDYLRQCLLEAGFTEAKEGAKVRGHNHGVINLAMTGVK